MMTESTIKLNDLTLWDNNPNEGDLGAIINSIKQFGYNGYVTVWQDNKLRGGNHSVMALRELERTDWKPFGQTIEVNERGEWLIGYIDISDMSEIKANAFGIALNRTTRLGQDNEEILMKLLQDIAAEDDELLIATAYDGDDLDLMLNEFDPSFLPIDDIHDIEHKQKCPNCGHEFML